MGISDHDLIFVVRKQKIPKPKARTIEFRTLKNLDQNAFLSDLSSAPWDSSYIYDNIDDIWSNWSDLYKQILDDHAPVKRIKLRNNQLPWISPDIQMQIRKCNRLYCNNIAWHCHDLVVRWRHLFSYIKYILLVRHLGFVCVLLYIARPGLLHGGSGGIEKLVSDYCCRHFYSGPVNEKKKKNTRNRLFFYLHHVLFGRPLHCLCWSGISPRFAVLFVALTFFSLLVKHTSTFVMSSPETSGASAAEVLPFHHPQVPAPNPLDVDGDRADNWKIWKQRWTLRDRKL